MAESVRGETRDGGPVGRMQSCIYVGHVEHSRLEPVRHDFRYRLFMMYLDLDELPGLFARRLFWSASRPAPARFRRSDYPGHASEPLSETIRSMVAASTGQRPEGPVRLLTNFRYLGLGFNPVSFFYCFSKDGERLEAVVAHVTSTPWGETHSYVVARNEGDHVAALRGSAAKRLHVSPFLPMDLTHEFRFTAPAGDLRVKLDDRRQGRTVFTAGLRMERREISTASLASVLLLYPWMTARVLVAIYFQALRLWRKKAPYHPHPAQTAGSSPAALAANLQEARRP
ncbi:MAG: DUF1365 domain-containing protein [Candidatus Binatia bacterium]